MTSQLLHDCRPHNNSRTRISGRLALLATFVVCIASLPSAHAASIFTLDSTQSTITITGDFAGIPLLEQSPGSGTAHFSGQFLPDLTTPGFIQFAPSTVNAIQQPGPFEPFSQPAAYATTVPGVGKAVFRELHADVLNSPSLAIDGLGSFDGSTIPFVLTSQYDNIADAGGSGSQVTSSFPLTSVAGISTFSKVGNIEQLTVPIDFVYPFVTVAGVATLNIHGQIVATHQIPEPATVVLLMAGLALLLGRKLWHSSKQTHTR